MPEEPVSMKDFLEKVHPSGSKPVTGYWMVKQLSTGQKKRELTIPPLRLHCSICDGERTFRSYPNAVHELSSQELNFVLRYLCGDCHRESKLYSLWTRFSEQGGGGEVYKYGELPPFGVPVPNKVLRLFGKDAEIFRKGRQCESIGHGVGAFAYYRRVVENHKNDLFDEIIKVCRTLNTDEVLISQLEAAKKEIAFSKALGTVKAALPQGLLINGHNPLLALHGALSVGLHEESDEACLEAASAVRIVLTDLVEKISLLKQDNKQLNDAVQLLLRKKQ